MEAHLSLRASPFLPAAPRVQRPPLPTRFALAAGQPFSPSSLLEPTTPVGWEKSRLRRRTRFHTTGNAVFRVGSFPHAAPATALSGSLRLTPSRRRHSTRSHVGTPWSGSFDCLDRLFRGSWSVLLRVHEAGQHFQRMIHVSAFFNHWTNETV